MPRASTQVTTNFAIGNDMLRINRNKDFINQIDMIKTLNRLNFSIILDTGVQSQDMISTKVHAK